MERDTFKTRFPPHLRAAMTTKFLNVIRPALGRGQFDPASAVREILACATEQMWKYDNPAATVMDSLIPEHFDEAVAYAVYLSAFENFHGKERRRLRGHRETMRQSKPTSLQRDYLWMMDIPTRPVSRLDAHDLLDEAVGQGRRIRNSRPVSADAFTDRFSSDE